MRTPKDMKTEKQRAAAVARFAERWKDRGYELIKHTDSL